MKDKSDKIIVQDDGVSPLEDVEVSIAIPQPDILTQYKIKDLDARIEQLGISITAITQQLENPTNERAKLMELRDRIAKEVQEVIDKRP